MPNDPDPTATTTTTGTTGTTGTGGFGTGGGILACRRDGQPGGRRVQPVRFWRELLCLRTAKQRLGTVASYDHVICDIGFLERS